MNTPEAMDYLAGLARRRQLGEFDIVGYDGFSEAVEVFEGKVSNTEISRSAALGIRVLKDSKPGLAFTEKLSADALEVCLADALSHTELTNPVSFVLPASKPPQMPNFDRRSGEFSHIGFQELTRFAIETEARLRSADPRIENVPYTGASRSSSTGYFLNSKGLSYSLTHEDFGAYTAAVAAEGEQKKMGFASNARTEFSELSSLPLTALAADRALSQLGAAPVSPGTYTVLFSNRVSGQLFSLYQSPFFAEVVQRGQSRLAGKLEQPIAAECLNLRSDALDPTLRGSRALDSEGVPTGNLAVIESGRLTSYLYNLEAAAIDKRTPTGNGVRSVGSKAGTGFKNLVVSPGKKTRDDLLSAGRILLIDKLEGAAGCSAVSGEFSIGAQGFLYENGRMLQPVDRITLSSNFFDMLRHIEAISCEYNDQYSSVRVPDVLIGGIAVAG
ncbi:MAG: TldD/PmbA family protein [Spirochaetota bacterium]